MKKLVIVFALALLAAVPSWASGIGVGMATWDTETAGDDQGIGVRIGFDVNDAVAVELRASFFDAFGQVGNNALYRLEVTPVDLGFSYHFNRGAQVEPYVGAGGTYLSNSVLFDGGQPPFTSGPEINDEFGFYFVAGVDVAVSDMFGVYGEALYRQAKLNVTGNGFGFSDFQADFTGPAASAGVMLHW